MRTLYIDCAMGAAGDMLAAALLELQPDPESALAELNALGLPGVAYVRESSVKCGVTGTHLTVLVHGEEEGAHVHPHGHAHEHPHEHDHEHPHPHPLHTGLHDIEHIVSHLPVSGRVKDDVLAVYGLIASAESYVHGVPVTDIHFHEVGTMDAVADVTAVCLLMDKLAPEQVVVSPVHVGAGQVRCAHGVLPVPAPATAYILRDAPIYGGQVQSELCTPTGAALLKHFAARFGDMPVMRAEAIGYGMGKKDFPMANCVRAFWGDTEEASDQVLELSCNVDDMTAEELGFALERLLDAGAKEAYTTPAGMKKSRPGTVLRVLCAPADREVMVRVLFKHTTTLGVRECSMRRYVLDRSLEERQTPHGPVGVKRASGWGVTRKKYEYDDLTRVARALDISLAQARELMDTE